LLLLIAGAGLLICLLKREKMNLPKIYAGGYVVMLLLLIAGAGLLIYLMNTTTARAEPEMQMGLLVVVAIATLMTVLFILAAGFSSMNLTDPKQALGLPEGSIRAMIALVLIMVFIIFGIYLFRSVGTSGTSTFIGNMTKLPDAEQLKGKFVISEELKDKTYNVWVISEINPDAKGLAQQLITTVGTLVVAVAGFYFGSSTATGVAKKERDELSATQVAGARSAFVINDVTPHEGEKGKSIDLEILGADFPFPKAVRLVRGREIMEGTEILSNKVKIQCKIMIDKEPGGKWDLIVENEDGKQAQSVDAFTIKAI
jgi:hypothetical protein